MPRTVRALIDTGADLTNISQDLITHFQLSSTGSVRSNTAGGSINPLVYRVSLSIPHPTQMGVALLELDPILVMEMLHPLPNIDVVLGMNALKHCLLILDGPRNEFTIAE